MFYVSLFAAWMVMGLFIKQVATVSQGRAELIRELDAANHEVRLARDREVELATLRERERLALNPAYVAAKGSHSSAVIAASATIPEKLWCLAA